MFTFLNYWILRLIVFSTIPLSVILFLHTTLEQISPLWHGSSWFLSPYLPARTFFLMELRSGVGGESKMPWAHSSYEMFSSFLFVSFVCFFFVLLLMNKWFLICCMPLVNFKNKMFWIAFILSIFFSFIIVFLGRFAELQALLLVKFHIFPSPSLPFLFFFFLQKGERILDHKIKILWRKWHFS